MLKQCLQLFPDPIPKWKLNRKFNEPSILKSLGLQLHTQFCKSSPYQKKLSFFKTTKKQTIWYRLNNLEQFFTKESNFMKDLRKKNNRFFTERTFYANKLSKTIVFHLKKKILLNGRFYLTTWTIWTIENKRKRTK